MKTGHREEKAVLPQTPRLHAKECPSHQTLERRGMDSSPESPEEGWHFNLGPVKLVMSSGHLNCEWINIFFFKVPSLWQFVIVAIINKCLLNVIKIITGLHYGTKEYGF